MIRHMAGSSRLSIVSLIVFFIAGIVLLIFVDVGKAREARNSCAI
jgi:MFS-type transporter involved in bile tolerance (Atg22 family)